MTPAWPPSGNGAANPPDDDPALQAHLLRIKGYMRGCGLLAFPSTETPLRDQLATFMERHLDETIAIWIHIVGPALGIAESTRRQVLLDMREAQTRWIAHIRNPDDVGTYVYLQQHARGGFISKFPPSRFLTTQLKIRQIVADLLRRDLRDHPALPELLGLLDQEFHERTLHVIDFFVEAREQDLEDQKESYRRSVDSAPAAMFMVDAGTGRITGSNRVAERDVGLSEEAILGQLWWELHPESERTTVRALFDDTLRLGAAGRENLNLQRHGRDPVPVDVRAALIEYGQNRAIQTIYVDLSERKRLELQLIQSEKMAAIGQLAAGIAHEIRNPLGIIMNALYDLAELLPEPRPEVQEDLQIARVEMARVQEIISNLLEFSRTSRVEAHSVDLDALIVQTLKLMNKYLQNNGVRAHVDLAAGAPCLASENGLRQVLLNLITNAVQAMPQGGELRIRTRGDRGSFRLEIADSGMGIPAERIGHIFNPFFTTKSPGEGTGLGLSVVHSVVKNAGGRIWVSSVAGGGTTFYVDLPLADAAATGRATGSSPATVPSNA